VSYLERAGNSLLSIYREANHQTRDGECPKRFKEPWTVIRPPVEAGPPPDVLPQEKLEAIELARRMIATAKDSTERGTATNLLGNALWRLGERESGTERLEEAVATYR
jgi:hypothetical protein